MRTVAQDGLIAHLTNLVGYCVSQICLVWDIYIILPIDIILDSDPDPDRGFHLNADPDSRSWFRIRAL